MSVTVLTPNGRRQNVKITPNTTLLQVLEEVCSKHGFKPEEYDIRHHNKILDVSSIFRFSGLPNNALLEMTEATKQRSESPVVLGLQMEGGERHTGEFIPSDNLWHVIMSLNPQAKSFDSPVAIYMRKEVCGRENLEKTTLRSLGLTGGRAIIRFLNRTPEELSTQANVSAVLSRSSFPVEEKKPTAQPKQTSSPNVERKKMEPSRRDLSSERQSAVKRIEEKKEEAKSSVSNESDNTAEKKSKESVKDGVTKTGRESPVYKEKKSEPQNIKESKVVNVEKKMQSNQNSPPKSIIRSGVEEAEKSKVILLGERNAVAYNLNNVKPSIFEEVPDDFYDLTIADAKLLLRDAKQLCADLENAPLMTSAQRELEKNKKMLSLLNQYKKTVLRIKFPDRTVLQGTFSSVEKVSAVEKFVAEYLQNPKISFYLYTTPPKEILKSDNNLLECNCVPCAVLYFGVSKDVEVNQFLRSDIMHKFSSPSAAALTAYESRGITPRKIKEEIEPEDEINEGKNVKSDSRTESNSSVEASTSSVSTSGRVPAEQGSSPPFKVPKWFKMNK